MQGCQPVWIYSYLYEFADQNTQYEFSALKYEFSTPNWMRLDVEFVYFMCMFVYKTCSHYHFINHTGHNHTSFKFKFTFEMKIGGKDMNCIILCEIRIENPPEYGLMTLKYGWKRPEYYSSLSRVGIPVHGLKRRSCTWQGFVFHKNKP